MKITKEKMPIEFIEAIPIMEQIEAAGYEAYFVGGSVRDVLLNKPIHDIDIATSAFPEEVKTLFPHTVDIGIEHGTVLVLSEGNEYEITTFRTESDYQDYRRPDEVVFVRSLEEDLKRRDFTINALAMNTKGDIIDLFDGEADLKAGIIRAVGLAHERFNEDALRMMRAVRFASQLDFSIEEQTFEAIKELSPLLQHISVERIHIEWIKLLLGKNRNKGIEAFVLTELYQYCPGLNEQAGMLKSLIELAPYEIESEEDSWVILCHKLSLKGQELTSFLKKWKLSNKIIDNCKKVVPSVSFRLEHEWDTAHLYPLNEEQVLMTERVLKILNVSYDVSLAKKKYNELPIHGLKDLAVTGSDLIAHLNQQPGPWLGRLLKTLEQAVLIGQVENNKLSLLNFLEERNVNGNQ
ncbi:CCA tRNA nucleotidyltransferase [Vagococcus xieshaowenii]|uniref:CCA-adding enzyme n=1 Tax=Vagococcus xieshaowenii TaxID=2562451 RepID=A0AAJ5JM76_9ENTE|nr:CCA tRNA nucleotidyltransferase [Vagococcus xieshaowenii]QCA28704.1 CCA tRNA nucleotidyltransferase [Vagococcus xieshaowenii]TFZ40666.1 CCA tRNA nucleotidyltransferase [Vagococcus xieshaowenii]